MNKRAMGALLTAVTLGGFVDSTGYAARRRGLDCFGGLDCCQAHGRAAEKGFV